LLLRRSIALNDFFAPSQAFLADVIALGSQPADALAPATKAISIDASSSSVRMSCARVLWTLSRRDQAKAAALAARALARSVEERNQAAELLDFFNRAPTN